LLSVEFFENVREKKLASDFLPNKESSKNNSFKATILQNLVCRGTSVLLVRKSRHENRVLYIRLNVGCCYDSSNASYNQSAYNQRTYMQRIICATDTLQSTEYVINGHYVQLHLNNQCCLQSILKRCNRSRFSETLTFFLVFPNSAIFALFYTPYFQPLLRSHDVCACGNMYKGDSVVYIS
jgi:hypothetical protein